MCTSPGGDGTRTTFRLDSEPSVTILNLVNQHFTPMGFVVLKILLAINIPPLRGYCASETWRVRSYYESPRCLNPVRGEIFIEIVASQNRKTPEG